MGLTGFEQQDRHTRRMRMKTSHPWPGGPSSENMPGATLTTQLRLEAATASGTGQRDFWSTESSFTSAPEQLHEQGTSCHCLCSCGLCSPVLRAPQRSSSHSILEHSHSSARLDPFQICHFSGLGGNVLPPATTENTFSISPAHLHGQSPPSLTPPIPAL